MRGEASRTALMAASGRALHLFNYGHQALVQDWLAYPLVGPEADAYFELGMAVVGEDTLGYATWHAARVRLTEDWLAANGAEQYVILGAGLDSFAFRQAGAITTYEFDHPASQSWKCERLAKLTIAPPEHLTMVGADFERDAVGAILRRSPIAFDRPLFVNWLGVLPYLSREAILETLTQLPRCTAAISYALPLDACDPLSRPLAEKIAALVSGTGEPFLTLTTPEETATLLESGGFRVEEDLGASDVVARYGLPCVSYERIVLATKR